MTFTAPRPISKTALTTLKGIGPAKALRLQHALQIESVEELLQFSLEEIHDRLAVEGPAIPLREIRQWLTQAQALVAPAPESGIEQAAKVSPATAALQANLAKTYGLYAEAAQQTEQPGQALGLEQALDQTSEQASIKMEETFKVSWHYSPDLGKSEKPFVQIEHLGSGECYDLRLLSPQALYAWLWKRLDQPQATPPETALPAESHQEAASPPSVDIMAVEMLSVEAASSAISSYSPAALNKGVAFAISAHFRVIAGQPTLGPQGLVASAQFYAKNRITGETVSLGIAQGKVFRTGETQILQSPSTTLSQSGLYQIQVVITLQNIKAAAGYRELKLLQVV